MNAIEKRIKNAYTKNELICICLNRINWNKRSIGYVRKIYLSNKFDLEIIDEFGQIKNKKTVPFASVKSLEIGGTYNENLKKLSEKGFLKNQSIPKYFSKDRHDLHKKLFTLKETNTVCTFFFHTEFSIGKVIEITKEELTIMNIAYDGTEDGISIFDLASLTKIRCGTNFENRISFLKKLSHAGHSRG